jgi:hypothetical protein
MSLQFEWDTKKADANFTKHRISFEEAMAVFADPLARIFDDNEYSEHERREIIIGHSGEHRLLLVSVIDVEERVRVLSARKATRRERKDYEEKVSF